MLRPKRPGCRIVSSGALIAKRIVSSDVLVSKSDNKSVQSNRASIIDGGRIASRALYLARVESIVAQSHKLIASYFE